MHLRKSSYKLQSDSVSINIRTESHHISMRRKLYVSRVIMIALLIVVKPQGTTETSDTSKIIGKL